MSRFERPVLGLALSLVALGCGDGHGHQHGDGGAADGGPVPHTLFATEGSTLVAFDVATGKARVGAIANVNGATDLQALATGHLLVNMTADNRILAVDASTFRELRRIPSSRIGATRPVHSFVTPVLGGKQYWAANNDGSPTTPGTDSLAFVDITAGSSSFLEPVGEIALGVGHHKNAWSPARARVSVSNIADCDVVMQVIDYTDASKPAMVKRWSAMEIDPARNCAMQAATPHGAAAASNGKGYHALTGWGVVMAVDQVADPPTFKVLPTRGNGAGYTKAGKDGRYIYSLQRTPREGDATRPGVDCQIGNLVVVDSQSDSVASEIPILLSGGCAAKLPAYARYASPDHLKITRDGKTMLVSSQAAPPAGTLDPAYSDQLQIFDLTDPARPTQKPSVQVGAHSGHRAMALAGDDSYLFIVNANDKSISQVDVKTLTVTRTITLKEAPAQVATFGTAEGPSAQTGPM